jgi:hypothetical protein
VKYEATASFVRDYRRLSRAEKDMFASVRKEFASAAERVAQGGRWPKTLRVKSVEGAPGIWEMTWSFSGPDGRATFEWIEIGGGAAIRWRRIGGHRIFQDPAR